ncbi:hypothetical protein EHQ57_16015 [Leptospira wolffii]|uniref:hypothetical protein n=1 Tax=Leptospira wolffii TaxID=409998 RepID=UPI001084484D|nr:hypothetical protein [Leptospira wolffii]TGK56250.1 hypothetical protein EHQ32_17755 [Leptospira wolffii]TGK72297.1 hypothetical protein EHQ35_13190 [Leptospira wolffii]TGL27874.1 hypothetical protein EHQ57_16015 [Leptospira wolffii]
MDATKTFHHALKVFSILSLSAFGFSEVLGDEVKLKSGKILKNLKMEKEAEDSYIFSLEDSIPVRIRKSDIEAITKSEELVPGDKTATIPSPGPKKHFDLIWTQSLTNDIFINGNSLFGNGYARRNDLSYSNVPGSLILDTSANIQTPLEGLTLTVRDSSPLTSRTNRDVDGVYQSRPYGPGVDAETAIQDSNTYRKRKEPTGLRELVATVVNYKWSTSRIGDWNVSWIYVSSSQPSFALGLIGVGWALPVFKYVNPTYAYNIRYTSERIGGSSIGGEKDQESGYPTNGFNGSMFHRFSLHHEYEIAKDFKVQPGVDFGYQYYNDNIDKRSGFKNIDYKVVVRYLAFFLSVTDVYRPNTYMIDNNYYYPNSVGAQNVGTVPGATWVQPLTSNSGDGLTVDPSKGYGLTNSYILNAIENSNLDPNLKQALVNHHLEQKIPLHSIIWSFGYSVRI